MSQQGERSGHEDDWWRELYDERTSDTGPAAAADSLDDRFDSAARAVGRADPTEPDPAQRVAEEGEWWQGSPGLPDTSPAGPAPEEWPEPTWSPRGRADADDDSRAEPSPSPRTGRPIPGARTPWEPPSTSEGPGPQPYSPPTGQRPSGTTERLSDLSADEPEQDLPAGGRGAVESRESGSPPGTLDGPRPPQEGEFVGDRPPTYEAEPVALPVADPQDLGALVPDTVLDGARYGSVTLRAASLRGDSARYRGEPRRDALLIARFGSGERALLLTAVASGARAATGAHRAAADACRWIGSAVGRSHARLAEDIRAGRRGPLKSGLHRLTDRSYGRLRARAAELGLDSAEYSATLRCLLTPADSGCRTRVFFGIGEGGLFRLRDGAWQDIEPAVPDDAEYGEPVAGHGSALSGDDRLTVDLGSMPPSSPTAADAGGTPTDSPRPSPHAEPFRFRETVARPGDTLLLCSSGLAEPLRGEPALAGLLAERWAAADPPGLVAFLADVQLRAKGYADDRTAAAVWER
ncbi:protein phosphatase 2C domain-containing protein [Streptomyces sp. KR80]|uniref:protein phosphatase 2C domain-containing protein n=1 Tax=Streptomyces sp. KR80 TaxID=3457426 RepID=UPI003FD1721B